MELGLESGLACVLSYKKFRDGFSVKYFRNSLYPIHNFLCRLATFYKLKVNDIDMELNWE
jgi:hypothetical protein